MNATAVRTFPLLFVLLASCFTAPNFVAAQAADPDASAIDLAKVKSAVAKSSDDEQAIRAAIGAYVDAYNRGDAAALAQLWSETGEWISNEGERLRGPKEIEAAMNKVFAGAPGAKLTLGNANIRLIAPDVAIEEGTATVTATDGSNEVSNYAATHVRRGKDWKLESVREIVVSVGLVRAPPPSPLAGLAWLVGRWVDDADGSRIETNVEWRAGGKFLFYQFRAILLNEEPLVGTQVIGFDAASGTIRSWMFDADGTIGEGTWTHDGKQWIVKSTQTLPDGTRAASTNVYEPRDAESFAWKSIGRKVGERFLPNIETVIVVRDKTEPAAAEAEGVKPDEKPAAAAKPTAPKK